jgi:beta-N-acetylhexosaminidase
VLGVFRQPGDFLDQFQRSYSMDPGVVGAAGSAFVAAQQRTGVATTIKHFPGLGAAEANEDTDLVPVTIDLPLETLRTVDLAPYPAGINAGARLVLSSWATYPALDPRPAGLSRQWMQGELRERLRFRGVTITDAMEAGALEPFGPTRRRAVLAADAGQDLLLFSSRSLAQGIEGRQSVARALGNGTIERKSFFTSLNRVMKLRADLADRPNGPLPAPG